MTDDFDCCSLSSSGMLDDDTLSLFDTIEMDGLSTFSEQSLESIDCSDSTTDAYSLMIVQVQKSEIDPK